MAKDLAQIYIRAKDETGGAFDSVKRNAQGVGDALGRVNGLLAGLGVGVSVGAFAMLVKGSIDAAAALDDLADSTALTVETLSSLQQTARIGGHSFDMVTGTATKFAKSVAEAAGGNKELLRSFDALGISQERLRTGKFDDLYTEFAAKIANAENKTYAIAHATDLAGKSAATALPFFKDLAETGLEQARVSTAQAAAADNLQKEVGRLGNAFDGIVQKISLGAIPVMSEWLEKVNSAFGATGNLATALNALSGLGQFGDTAAEQIRNIDVELKKIEEHRKRGIGHHWMAGALGGIRESNLLDMRAIAASRLPGPIGAVNSGGLDGAAGDAPFRIGAPQAAAGPKDTSFRTLLDQLRQKATLEKESTETEKLLFELSKERYAKLSVAQKTELADLARTIDAKTALAAASKDYAEQITRADDAQEKADKALADFNRTQTEALKNLEFETSLLGQTETQRETAIALRKLENEYLQASIRLVGEENDAYVRRMETTRSVYEQQRSALPGAVSANVAAREAVEAQKKLVEESKRAHEQINQSLTDALLRGFESGKGFAENFRDTVRNLFSTLVLRPLIQPVVQAGAGLITGALGIPGLANAAGGSGGGLSMLGGGASLLQALGGGIGGSFGAGLTYAGSSGVGVMGGLAEAFTGGGSLGFSAGAALPAIGIGLGALALGKSMGLFGGKGTYAQTVGYRLAGDVGAGSGFSGSSYALANNAGTSYADLIDAGTTGAWGSSLAGGLVPRADALRQAARTLGLDGSALGGRFSVDASGATFGDALESALNQVSDQMANALLPNLREFAQAGETAAQTLIRLAATTEQLQAQQDQVRGQLSGAVRALPGQLGITSLTSARDALALGEYSSPTDRLATARSLLDSTYQRGISGDLTAVNSYGSVLQQSLGVARELGASGPAFQALFTEGNRQLNDLLARQQQVQTDILKDLPITIMEATQNQTEELKRAINAQSEQLKEVNENLRLLRLGAV